MGILKTITEEYFGETVRKEDEINIEGLDVEIVSFTDNNKKYHKKGYKPKDKDNLKKLLERMIEVRGDKGDFNDIDTSDITSMESLFEDNETFNGDITGWDVSNVENMKSMFYGSESFDQPIGDWNVSNVTNMCWMFYHAKSFNQPIGDWNVSNVKDMGYMFCGATSFNQPIDNWDVSSVEYMFNMFECAKSFNQPIGNWDINSVISIFNMFKNAESFNQDLSKWDLTEKHTDDIFDGCPIKDKYKPKTIKVSAIVDNSNDTDDEIWEHLKQ